MDFVEIVKKFGPTVVALFGAVIVVTGWNKNSQFNKENDIFKQRLSERINRRVEMLDSIVRAVLPFVNPVDGRISVPENVIKSLLEKARLEVQLFGNEEEMNLYEEFISSIHKQDVSEVNKAISRMVPIIRKNFRSELGYEES